MGIGSDVDAQRKGIVFVVWFDVSLLSIQSHSLAKVVQVVRHGFEMSMRYNNRFLALMSVRCSALHICSPKASFFRMVRSVLAIGFGSDNRSRLKLHTGTSIELWYTLQGYGIPMDHLAISCTGKI